MIKILREFFIIGAGNIVSMAGGVAFFVIASRLYQTAEFGRLAYIYASAQVLGASIGGAVALSAIVTLQRSQWSRIGGVFRAHILISSLGLSAATSLAIVIISICFSLDVILSVECILPIISVSAATLGQGYLNYIGRNDLMLRFSAERVFIQLCGIVFPATFVHQFDADVVFVSSYLVLLWLSILRLRPGGRPILGYRKALIRRIISRSISMYISGIIPLGGQMVLQNHVSLQLGGGGVVGALNIARQWQGAVQLSSTIQSGYFMPRMVNRPDLGGVFEQHRVVSIASCILVSFLWWQYGVHIVKLYQLEDSSGFNSIMSVMIISSIILQYYNPLGNVLISERKYNIVAAQNTAFFVVFVSTYIVTTESSLVSKLIISQIVGTVVFSLLQITIYYIRRPYSWWLPIDAIVLFVGGVSLLK